MEEQSLGDEWFRSYYPKIREALNYDQTRDEESRDLLSILLTGKKISFPDFLLESLQQKNVVMFGAGPSLDHDLEGLGGFVRRTDPIIVAADGAADALYQSGLPPSIIVSDLDSCSLKSLEEGSQRGFVFVHSHGDNMDLVRKIVPKLGPKIFGTTQVSSVRNVRNFGGLTDGDRACFVISYFMPSSIIIAGMDFGSAEGRFSKNKYAEGTDSLRPTKLTFGKESLEFLIRSRPEIKFVNVTRFGEEIRGARKVEYSKVTRESSLP